MQLCDRWHHPLLADEHKGVICQVLFSPAVVDMIFSECGAIPHRATGVVMIASLCPDLPLLPPRVLLASELAFRFTAAEAFRIDYPPGEIMRAKQALTKACPAVTGRT